MYVPRLFPFDPSYEPDDALDAAFDGQENATIVTPATHLLALTKRR